MSRQTHKSWIWGVSRPMGRATAVFVNPLFSQKIAQKWSRTILKPILSNYTLNAFKMAYNFSYTIFIISAVCLQFAKFIAIKKIRPFFKLARQVDSKNAKIFWKSLFFSEILLRKPLNSHATSQIFCSKKLPWYAYNYTWILKKFDALFSKVENVTIWL